MDTVKEKNRLPALEKSPGALGWRERAAQLLTLWKGLQQTA